MACNNIRSLGIDIGNHSLKLFEFDGRTWPIDPEAVVKIPNVISPFKNDSTLVEENLTMRLRMDAEVSLNGTPLPRRFYGQHAYSNKKALKRTIKNEFKSQNEELMCLLVASVAAYFYDPLGGNSQKYVVAPAVGLPIHEYKYANKKMVKYMEEKLNGTKKVKFYAPPPADCLEVTIDFVSPVVKPECIGAHIGSFRDYNLEFSNEYQQYANKTILGLDIGNLTTDFCAMQGKNYIDDYSDNVEEGTRYIFKKTTDEFFNSFGRRVSIEDIEVALESNNTMILTSEGLKDIKPLLEKYSREFVYDVVMPAVMAKVNEQNTVWNIDCLALFGGGAGHDFIVQAFKDYMEDHKIKWVLLTPSSPSILNVIGFSLFAYINKIILSRKTA